MNRLIRSLTYTCLLLSAACGGLENGRSGEPTDPTSTEPAPSSDSPEIPRTDVPVLPQQAYAYTEELPAHFDTRTLRGFDNTPTDNPISDAGATLGRVLFYDMRLSRNESTACATCHPQERGFSDTIELSEGFEGGLTGRNSMPLINLRYYHRGAMFWDERAASLEEQVLMPIQDEVEMGMTLEDLVARLEGTDFYPELFASAFGDSAISSERVSLALAQFIRSIVSYRAKWDVGVAQVNSIAEDFPNYTDLENEGKAIFFGQSTPELPPGLCGTCHLMQNPLAFAPAPPPGAPAIDFDNTAVFFMIRPANNGLLGDDEGFGEVSGRPEDVGTFKSPSLRNVGLTGPYMHDGRFATLEAVVEFYDRDIGNHMNLDPALRGRGRGGPVRMNLGRNGRRALVAFLLTLTDPTIAEDVRWSNPFPVTAL
jgi:cytochrome c peroxidase